MRRVHPPVQDTGAWRTASQFLYAHSQEQPGLVLLHTYMGKHAPETTREAWASRHPTEGTPQPVWPPAFNLRTTRLPVRHSSKKVSSPGVVHDPHHILRLLAGSALSCFPTRLKALPLAPKADTECTSPEQNCNWVAQAENRHFQTSTSMTHLEGAQTTGCEAAPCL